jgi:hypothetical protein
LKKKKLIILFFFVFSVLSAQDCCFEKMIQEFSIFIEDEKDFFMLQIAPNVGDLSLRSPGFEKICFEKPNAERNGLIAFKQSGNSDPFVFNGKDSSTGAFCFLKGEGPSEVSSGRYSLSINGRYYGDLVADDAGVYIVFLKKLH